MFSKYSKFWVDAKTESAIILNQSSHCEKKPHQLSLLLLQSGNRIEVRYGQNFEKAIRPIN